MDKNWFTEDELACVHYFTSDQEVEFIHSFKDFEWRAFAKHESDDTIEGFIHSKYPINGVMWHPERKQNEYSLEFLKKFCSL